MKFYAEIYNSDYNGDLNIKTELGHIVIPVEWLDEFINNLNKHSHSEGDGNSFNIGFTENKNQKE